MPSTGRASESKLRFLESARSVDPHSPGDIRAIGPLVNFEPFYEAFGIKEGDPMWIAPEKRVHIW